jgi:hypothetical protein
MKMPDKIHTLDTAAARLGLAKGYLRSLIKERSGPPFFRPSSKKTLFWESELDAWKRSWLRFEPLRR